VLEELELDGTMQLKRPEAADAEAGDPINLPQLSSASAAVSAAAIEQFKTMLAERDAQILELQQAVIELANAQDDAPPVPIIDPGQSEAIAAIEAKLAGIESKMLEQERTIRHTLTMLIEWIEADDASRAAA
jgi:general secretion pathway protein A